MSVDECPQTRALAERDRLKARVEQLEALLRRLVEAQAAWDADSSYLADGGFIVEVDRIAVIARGLLEGRG